MLLTCSIVITLLYATSAQSCLREAYCVFHANFLMTSDNVYDLMKCRKFAFLAFFQKICSRKALGTWLLKPNSSTLLLICPLGHEYKAALTLGPVGGRGSEAGVDFCYLGIRKSIDMRSGVEQKNPVHGVSYIQESIQRMCFYHVLPWYTTLITRQSGKCAE